MIIDRRQSLALLGALWALGGGETLQATKAAPGEPFSWDGLKARAAGLAKGKLPPLPQPVPAAHAIDYDAANRIVFRTDRAIGTDDGYSVQLFTLTRNGNIPISLSVIDHGVAHRIEHSEDMFKIVPGDGPTPKVVPGISGFRVMNKGGVGDWLAYMGASYFRSAGTLDQYGLSARGLAVDTGIDGAEEFPVFTEFWLERTDGGLVVYALLESASVTGAYRFVIHKSSEAVVQDVSMAIFLRKDIARLGIAPLTSMFWYGEGNPQQRIDWRPEIHDSDGLLVRNSAGERLWRPLVNPPSASINSFVDAKGASAYGLLQRDRSFDHYQDDGVFYEKRPNLWVEPKGDWGPGAVMLYEIPTIRESDDNIVAFWTPAKPAKAGMSFAFDYRLHWTATEPEPSPLAHAVDRWTGTAGRPGLDPIAGARRLVVDFEGPSLKGKDRNSGITASALVDRGKVISAETYPVVGQPGRWRLIVDSTIEHQPVNVRVLLKQGDKPLTETVIHQFS